jgi:hypothetical protein
VFDPNFRTSTGLSPTMRNLIGTHYLVTPKRSSNDLNRIV